MASERDESRRVVCAPRARAALLTDLGQRPRIEACGLLLGDPDRQCGESGVKRPGNIFTP